MTSKFLKIFLPTTIAFIAFVGLLKLDDILHSRLFSASQKIDDGPAAGFSDSLVFVALILPYIFCLFFQGLIILPFWTKINLYKKIRGLNFWQIVGLTTLMMLIIIFLIGLLEGYKMKLLVLNCVVFLLMFVIYFTINFLTLKIIDKKKNELKTVS